MVRSVAGMRARQERDVYSRTVRGRMLNSATALFGVYCIYRVVIVSAFSLAPSLGSESTASYYSIVLPEPPTPLVSLNPCGSWSRSNGCCNSVDALGISFARS